MPIPVTCQCGARFAAKDEMAGQRAKCPKCQAVLTVPAAGAPAAAPAGDPLMAGLFEEEGFVASKTGVRCPSCRQDMKQGAILCLNCGYNTQTGKKLETKVEVSVPNVIPESRRSRRRESEWPAELPNNLTWGKFLLGVGGYAALGIVVALISRPVGGFMLMAPGCIAMLYAGITVLMLAFQENVLLGLLYLFCDLYKIYFIVTNWDNLKAAVAVFGAGWLIAMLGVFFISIS